MLLTGVDYHPSFQTIGASGYGSIASELGLRVLPIAADPAFKVAAIGDARHRKDVPWLVQENYRSTVTASVHYVKNGKKLWDLAGRAVPKKMWLKFTIQTNVPDRYGISWQVVNTGNEEFASHGLVPCMWRLGRFLLIR